MAYLEPATSVVTRRLPRHGGKLAGDSPDAYALHAGLMQFAAF